MAIAFFCTRCGIRLGLADELTGGPVRCPRCTAIVRSPESVDDIPTAMLADTDGIGMDYFPTITTGGLNVVQDDVDEDDVAIDDLAAAVIDAAVNRSAWQDKPFDYDEFVALGEDEMLLNEDGLELNYARPNLPRHPRGSGLPPAYVTELARRLATVEPGEANDGSSMTHCPYCDSTIAPYVGKCPFCRHPLK